MRDMMADVAANMLLQIADLQRELATVKAERDAAVADIIEVVKACRPDVYCSLCVNEARCKDYSDDDEGNPYETCDVYASNFRWRGVQPGWSAE